MRDYHINIFYGEEDGGYVADIPDLKSCSAFGETPDEALGEVLKAKEVWLAAARQNKKPIPSPRYKPLIYQTVSVGYCRASVVGLSHNLTQKSAFVYLHLHQHF